MLTWRVLIAALMLSCTVSSRALAQTAEPDRPDGKQSTDAGSVMEFLGGAALAFGSHEGAHLVLNLLFDANPRVDKVDFAGIPFFAISHRADVSPRREYLISSAGFSMQHALDEWLLSRRPRLRDERAPLAKGLLAFNVLASVAYSGAAFARVGPYERDTRAMASSRRIDERWIGALVVAPAVLDAWRYFDRDPAWARWSSRALKVGMVVLVLK